MIADTRIADLPADSVYRLGFGPGWAQLRCGFQQCPSGLRQVGFTTRQFAIVYLLRGTGVLSYPTSSPVDLSAGDLICRFPDQPHDVHLTAGAATAFLAIPAAQLQVFKTVVPRLFGASVCHAGLHEAILDRWVALRGALRDATQTELGQIVLDMARFVLDLHHSTTASTADTCLEQARDRLARDHASRLSLPALSAELGLGYSSFRAGFRERFGVSPGEYRLRCRIGRAQELLQITALSVGAIAQQLGYPDVCAFSAQFARHVGTSPTSFRLSGEPKKSSRLHRSAV